MMDLFPRNKDSVNTNILIRLLSLNLGLEQNFKSTPSLGITIVIMPYTLSLSPGGTLA